MSTAVRVPRRRHLGFVVGCFVSLATLHAQTAPAWLPRFQAAADQLRAGDAHNAIEQFEKLWASHPQDHVLANAIGATLDSVGKHSEAERWYRKALALNPRFASAHNNLGLNYAARRDFAKAVGPLQRAGELDPSNERAFYNLGLVYLQLGEFSGAADAFERAHKLKPLEANALIRLAYSQLRAGQTEQGKQSLHRLLSLPGNSEKGWVAALQTLNGAGLFDEALVWAERARKNNAVSSPVQFEEAKALFRLGRYPEAVARLEESRPASGPDFHFQLLLGSARALSGDLPGAVEALQRAVEINPQEPEVYYRLALTFLAGFRDREALEVLVAGLEGMPRSTRLFNGMATYYELTGNLPKAAEYLERALDADPSQQGTWIKAGELYEQLGQHEKAKQAYATAVKLGGAPRSITQYADLLIRFGQYDEAERALRPLLESSNITVEPLISLGKLHYARKQFRQAEEAFRRALELDPEEDNAHLHLGRTLQRLGREAEAKRETELANRLKEAARGRTMLRRTLVPLSETSNTEW